MGCTSSSAATPSSQSEWSSQAQKLRQEVSAQGAEKNLDPRPEQPNAASSAEPSEAETKNVVSNKDSSTTNLVVTERDISSDNLKENQQQVAPDQAEKDGGDLDALPNEPFNVLDSQATDMKGTDSSQDKVGRSRVAEAGEAETLPASQGEVLVEDHIETSVAANRNEVSEVDDKALQVQVKENEAESSKSAGTAANHAYTPDTPKEKAHAVANTDHADKGGGAGNTAGKSVRDKIGKIEAALVAGNNSVQETTVMQEKVNVEAEERINDCSEKVCDEPVLVCEANEQLATSKRSADVIDTTEGANEQSIQETKEVDDKAPAYSSTDNVPAEKSPLNEGKVQDIAEEEPASCQEAIENMPVAELKDGLGMVGMENALELNTPQNETFEGMSKSNVEYHNRAESIVDTGSEQSVEKSTVNAHTTEANDPEGSETCLVADTTSGETPVADEEEDEVSAGAVNNVPELDTPSDETSETASKRGTDRDIHTEVIDTVNDSENAAENISEIAHHKEATGDENLEGSEKCLVADTTSSAGAVNIVPEVVTLPDETSGGKSNDDADLHGHAEGIDAVSGTENATEEPSEIVHNNEANGDENQERSETCLVADKTSSETPVADKSSDEMKDEVSAGVVNDAPELDTPPDETSEGMPKSETDISTHGTIGVSENTVQKISEIGCTNEASIDEIKEESVTCLVADMTSGETLVADEVEDEVCAGTGNNVPELGTPSDQTSESTSKRETNWNIHSEDIDAINDSENAAENISEIAHNKEANGDENQRGSETCLVADTTSSETPVADKSKDELQGEASAGAVDIVPEVVTLPDETSDGNSNDDAVLHSDAEGIDAVSGSENASEIVHNKGATGDEHQEGSETCLLANTTSSETPVADKSSDEMKDEVSAGGVNNAPELDTPPDETSEGTSKSETALHSHAEGIDTADASKNAVKEFSEIVHDKEGNGPETCSATDTIVTTETPSHGDTGASKKKKKRKNRKRRKKKKASSATTSEDADNGKEEDDVQSESSDDQRLRIAELLNVDPWSCENAEAEAGFSELELLFGANPDLCAQTYKLDSFNESVYPLSALCSIGAPVGLVTKCIDAYEDALSEKDPWVGNPLHYACAYKAKLPVVEALVDRRPACLAESNEFQRLPLHMACMFSAGSEVITYLLDKNPSASEVMDKEGLMPLHLACDVDDLDLSVIERLAEAHSDACTVRSIANGWTPLVMALTNLADLNIVKTLGDPNVEVLKIVDDEGNTPLHVAISSDADFDVCNYLTESFPDAVAMKNDGGETPVALAERSNTDQSIIDILKKQG